MKLITTARRRYYPVGTDCSLYHAYWDGTAKDHSIRGNHGQLNGDASFGPNGVYFHGTNGNVSIPVQTITLQMLTFDYSIFLWINIPYPPQAVCQILACHGSGDASGLSINYLANGPAPYDTGVWGGGCGTDWDKYIPAMNTTDVPITGPYNQWYLLGYEIDRDVGGYLSFNGVRKVGPTGPLEETSMPVWFDGFFIGGDAIAPDTFLIGAVGEIYVFKSIKSDDERLDLFNRTKVRYGL
jgi:hypothetical protein